MTGLELFSVIAGCAAVGGVLFAALEMLLDRKR